MNEAKHVVFCIAPFSGHVNPSLAVVSELASRGHRVSYATTAEFSRPARDAGGRAVVYDTPVGPPQDARVTQRDPAGGAAGHDFARGLSGQLGELKAVLPVLISAFADDAPDAVVCDPMCWAGRALAARCQIPPINSVTTMISKARWSLGPVNASFNPAHPALPQLFAATSAVLAHYGTGLTADHLLGTGAMIPTIVYHPLAFEAQGDQFGPDVHFVGPCMSSRRNRPGGGPGNGPHWRPPGNGPVVLMSLGTVFNRQPALFRRCIEAFAELSCTVVAALGGLDAAALGPLPPNTQAHRYLELTEVLRYTDVFVGHGGMTSTMESLSFGVPIVALPQISEQGANAGRLAQLGLGLCLEPAQQTQEAVRRAVTTLLHDASYRPRLNWMRAEIERAPGAPAAAGVIENALHG
jgi:demethyllactenocin mycarosyltransferase